MRQLENRKFVTRWLMLAWATAAILAAFAQPAGAHNLSSAYSDIRVDDRTLHYHLSFTEADYLKIVSADRNGDGKLEDDELAGSLDLLAKAVDDGLIVTGNGKLGTAEIKGAERENRASLKMIGIDLAYVFPEPVQTFLVQYQFLWASGADPNHTNFAMIYVGGQTIQQVLGSQNNIIQIEGAAASGSSGTPDSGESGGSTVATAPSSSWATLKQYTVMGMEHIWSGLDHMLFVAGLLLGANRNAWAIVKTITAFTVGHCITLVLSSLELAYMSPVIVEPLIALSIVYIAVENIWRKPEEHKRYVITLLFGLIHGFGFAEVLRGTLSGHMALPLFSFNLGVEIGQLGVVAACVPIIAGLGRIQMKFNWVHYASGVVGLIGLFWLVERIG
ncbi:HupE/UreJ family protein [Cohnella soli]|uniref:HupE/UreJ family protein n=1 Tax=Cohnella soli TaxID=425005 RepID=A0ABW0HNQ6_9BACL